MSHYSCIVLLVVILCQVDWSRSQDGRGHLVPIDSYTLPNELEQIYGSQGENGCGSVSRYTVPPLCTDTPVEGTIPNDLTDGDFPDPGDMEANWARGFFTLSRSSSSSIFVSFRLERSVVIGEVQLHLLNCPKLGIGTQNIKLYGSLTGFPGYSTSQATQLGSITVPDNTSCTVLNLTISSSVNSTFRDYFLAFNYESSPNITWLFLGEVQFFETDSTPIPTSSIPFTYPVPTPIPTLTSSTLSTTMIRTTHQPTSTVAMPSSTSAPYTSSLSFPSSTPTDVGASDSSDDTLLIITAVVVVIFLLLCTAVIILLLLIGLKMRRKHQLLQVEKLQNAMLEHKSLELTDMNSFVENGSMTKPSEPPVYSEVQKTSKVPLSTPSPFIGDYTELDKPDVTMGEQDGGTDVEGYSCVPEKMGRSEQEMYAVPRDTTPPKEPKEQPPAQMTGQPEVDKEALAAEDGPVYALVDKDAPPSVPGKSTELVEYLETKPLIVPTSSPPPPTEENETAPEIPDKSAELVDYLEAKAHVHTDLAEEYAEVQRNTSNANTIYSPPILTAENHSAHVYEAFGDEDNIYTEPDILRNQTDGVYDTVYSEPLKPALFIEENKPYKNAEELHPYAPIYTVPTAPLKETEKPVEISSSSVQEIRQLGVGMFGQVILAKTVGLSLKDLRLHPTDDDKSRSVLVAMKTLKPNAPSCVQEAFQKELNFIGRLNDPNVVRSLGVCRGDTPFILMEYMEYGDLNQHLQKFTEVVPANRQCVEGQISASTLLYMATQIASGMKHLASLNVVHRDLATRNCLVDNNFAVKISDFGMSRSLYESHYYRIGGRAILPIRWMATECFYGMFSQKTDVWAFGVTMWEIFELAKEQPYDNMSEQEVIRNAIQGKTKKLLSKPIPCPAEIYQAMLRCWAYIPNERPNFDELHTTLSFLI